MSDKPVVAGGQAWRWLLLAVYVAILVGLTIAWRDPSMKHWREAESLSVVGKQLLATPLGPLAVIGGYVVAVMLGMPVLVLVAVGALIFPPWPGMLYAMAGMLTGALTTYGIGRFTGAQTVDRWTKGRLALVSSHLQRRGLVTMVVVRVLPVAPFIMVNMVAGALRVRLFDYIVGSCLGLTPATVGIFMFMDKLTEAMRSPSTSSYAALGAWVLGLVVVFVWMRKRFSRVV